MKWQKLGRIFVSDKQHDWMLSHASVPFAEQIKDDRFRIYFSSRDDSNRSFTGYIEIDITNPQDILSISSKPVLSPGEVGMFDDSGAMLSWITTNGGDKYLYYIGWNLGVTVPFRNSIGLATCEKDKKVFKKISKAPVLDRNYFDPSFVAGPCVRLEGEVWRMWYLSCTGWETVGKTPRHRYHIKYAESTDGIHWNRDGKVCIDFANENEYAISRPCVLKDGKIYKMWYSYRGENYRIGYAESFNGTDWVRKDKEVGIDVSSSGWDSEMIEYPFVFSYKDKRYMLYNGNGYGKTGFGLAVQNSG